MTAEMQEIRARAMGRAQDRPGLVNVCLLAVVGVAAGLVLCGVVPNAWLYRWGGLLGVTELYIGATAASTIAASLSAAVVLYGVTHDSPSLRMLRTEAGPSLARNWTSALAFGLISALLCLLAAALNIGGYGEWAFWAFVLAVLWLIHGSWRTIWLLRALILAARADDAPKYDAEHNTVDTAGNPPR